jgi:glycosyltransferase involved in cell wall biosynthesis
LKILLIGIDFSPNYGSHYKNFWLNFAKCLVAANGVQHVTVLSVNREARRHMIVEAGEKQVSVLNHWPGGLSSFFNRGWDGQRVPPRFYRQSLMAAVERSLSVISMLPDILNLVKSRGITHIHWMDNFGPMMAFPRVDCPKVRVSATALAYTPGRRGYDAHIRQSYGRLDTIMPITQAYGRKLVSLGLPDSRVNPIMWGVPCQARRTEEKKASFKKSLGLDSSARVVLWTGPTTNLGNEAVEIAYSVAKTIVEKQDRTNLFFLFAYKKAWAAECSLKCQHSGDNIRVFMTDHDEFLSLLMASDILFAPIVKRGSIVAPPLTWLEAMALGIPVLTNDVLGTEEVVDNGLSGWRVSSDDDFASYLRAWADDPAMLTPLSQGACHLIENSFALEHSVAKYLDSWGSGEI